MLSEFVFNLIRDLHKDNSRNFARCGSEPYVKILQGAIVISKEGLAKIKTI
jgi:hypothetical protein